MNLFWQPSSGGGPGPLREALWRFQERKWMPRGSPGGGLLDLFSAFFGIRFRGRFWVICLMTCGGLGEPPGSLNLRGSATNLTRQRSPSRGAANRRRLAALHRSPPKAPHWEMWVEPSGSICLGPSLFAPLPSLVRRQTGQIDLQSFVQELPKMPSPAF